MSDPDAPAPAKRQPIFNLPEVVTFLVVTMLGIQFIREYLLSPDTDLEVLFTFAFIPARISEAGQIGAVLPGGSGAEVWTFLTYAFLHADWGHVGINSLWLAAFGSPLAWRLGTARFLLFSAAGAIGGALVHLAIHSAEMTPMVGASAAISAHMAGVSRFMLTGGLARPGAGAYQRPAAPLSVILRDSRVISFLAVWFGLNFLFGVLGAASGIASGAIAWEAHVGGFLTGLVLFPLFDPVPARPTADRT
jgi:membrane associated rhomboid family serine protease